MDEPIDHRRVDDAQLIAAIRAGDEAAYRQLVDAETPPLYRLVLGVVGRPADAEDVLQDTFLTALRSFHTFRGDGSLRGWLMRIAVRLAYRRARRASDRDIESVAEPETDDDTSDPVGSILSRERRECVRLAVAALPEPYREAIALRYLAGLSVEETASTLGRSVNTTKSQLQRGLRRLRPLLSQEVAA